jgi:hypothetical protein
MVARQQKIYIPKQIHDKITDLNKTDFHALIAKDIHWTLIRNDTGLQSTTRTKQIQLQSFYLKVYYGKEKYIEALFPDNVSVKFGAQYFKDYSAIKFASLIFLLLDRFGPIRNPMAFSMQTVRQQLGLYRQFNSKMVLRNSLREDAVYQTLLCMVRSL